MLRMVVRLALTLLALLLAVPAVSAPPAAVIARDGNGHGAPACGACHGADGEGQATAGFPRLAGLSATHLLHQLDSFADGTRTDMVMTPIAKSLSTSERKALADYYAGLPVPASRAPSVPAASAGVGEALALHGRWSRQVPSCIACHGPHGEGVGTDFPPLAGQPASYIASQLQAFKSGTRHNDPLGLMRHVASALTDADIKAVSAWFAAEPVMARRGKG